MRDLRSLLYSSDDAEEGRTPGYFVVDGDPDGILEAAEGSQATDPDTGIVYIRTAGATTNWDPVAGPEIAEIPVLEDDVSYLQNRTDRRVLSAFFDGGIAGKTIVFSGDSTTLNMTTFASSTFALSASGAAGGAQYWWPQLKDVSVYARGTSGQTLAGFLAGGGAAGYTLPDLIALDADAYVFCWGINDCRTTTAYTAAMLQADLTTLVETIRAAVPRAVIVLRTPNAHETGSGLITGAGNTAQICMDRYATAYRALRGEWGNVLVYDSLSGQYNNNALAAGSANLVVDNDGLHPAQNAYALTIYSVCGLFLPQEDLPVNQALALEQSVCCPLELSDTITASGRVKWAQEVDPQILESDEYYKVFRVAFSAGAVGSFYDLAFTTAFAVNDNTQGNLAMRGVGPSFAGRVAPGFVPGDIISFQTRADNAYTFVVNAFPDAELSQPIARYFSGGPAAYGISLPTGNPYGFVYRHKYAFSDQMRRLMTVLATDNQTEGEQQAATPNPYAVARRFYIAVAAVGSIRVQTIASEPTGDLCALAWSVNDTLIIPGVSANQTVSTGRPQGFALTNATFDAVTFAAAQQVLITFGGADASVDFRNAVIPQGYVLSAA